MPVTSRSLDYSPLTLPGGWSGRVLVKCHDAGLSEGSALRLPDFAGWREWLGVLVADSRRLPGAKTLKCSATVEVVEARLPTASDAEASALDVVCKRSTASGAVARTLALVRRSRARCNFDRALRLLDMGVHTAVPLAFIERRPFGPSWLVSVRLTDVVDLDRVALSLIPRLDPRHARHAKNGALRAAVDLPARLHRANWHHRDLKASNILLARWDRLKSEPVAYLVDLDGLSPRRWWRGEQRWQPLIRLGASLLGYSSITHTDYIRAVREYLLHCGDDPGSWRDHFPRLAARAADYARRAQRRKSDKLDGFSGG